MSVREKLQALGLELPEAPSPKGDYVPVTIHGGVAYVSGQVCRQGDSVITGPVTDQTSTELVNEAGQTCVLRALSVLDQAVGLENVERFAELQLDRDFAPLTLVQMKNLEPLAFERAGLL